MRLRRKMRTDDLVRALYALRREFPEQRETIVSAVMYAEIGRDRRKLGTEYVESTRQRCKDMQKFSESLTAALEPPGTTA